MDGELIDRIAIVLAGRAPRRHAVRLGATAGLATAALGSRREDTVAKKRKKRCRKRVQTCGGKQKCCNKTGPISCEVLSGSCADNRPGRRCCGLSGAACDPAFGDCDCCDFLSCTLETDGSRCLP